MEIIATLNNTLSELVRERDALNADIEDLTRVIARHNGGPHPKPRRKAGRRRAALPGEGRQQLLALLANGGEWSPSMIAKERGTSTNAARTMLKRIAAEEDSPIEKTEGGYKLASVRAGR